MIVTTISKRFIQTVRPHTPLIKFRKGLIGKEQCSFQSNQSSVSFQQPVESRPVLEYHQLPSKYRRPLLDEKEIEAINSGGAF